MTRSLRLGQQKNTLSEWLIRMSTPSAIIPVTSAQSHEHVFMLGTCTLKCIWSVQKISPIYRFKQFLACFSTGSTAYHIMNIDCQHGSDHGIIVCFYKKELLCLSASRLRSALGTRDNYTQINFECKIGGFDADLEFSSAWISPLLDDYRPCSF